jgi:hypothetical protein
LPLVVCYLLGRVSRSAFPVAVGDVSADAFPGEYISDTLTTPRLSGGVGMLSTSVVKLRLPYSPVAAKIANSSAEVMEQRLARFEADQDSSNPSTLTSLRGSADERSTSRSGRGVARSRARHVGSDGLREVVIAQWMPDTAEFRLAFRGMMPAQILTTGEVFSPLAQSRLLTGQGPTPTSVGIHYGPSERTAPVFFGSNGAGGSRGSGE